MSFSWVQNCLDDVEKNFFLKNFFGNLLLKFGKFRRGVLTISISLPSRTLRACSHRAFAFAIFCIIQCRKRFHLSLVLIGDANARCRRAFKGLFIPSLSKLPKHVSNDVAFTNALCEQTLGTPYLEQRERKQEKRMLNSS